ncbi:MAG: tRNA-dihydrouridine synthase family protein [Clostridia bacterium]|nr:tRNA-dihydrouridine synthase family protein [Clostridia bacterium]
MKINDLDFSNNPLFLAPMAGVTDVGFRAIASSFGADATVTEMLSARAMAHNPQKTKFLTLTTEEEKIKIAQIFGHEESFMQEAIKSSLLEKFDMFDINMGCPAPKIVKNGEGSALMDNLPLASKIISACKQVSDKPLSVKFRKGKSSENYVEFGRMCQESGADFVTFHARTVEQGYSGRADLDAIASLKAKLSIPVIGNGDVVDRQSYEKMLQTGVDGVMIGRGATGKPWLFAELKNREMKIDKFSVVEKHISLLREHFEEDWLKLYIRKHFLWYASDFPMSANVRLKLATCQDIDECLNVLKQVFNAQIQNF